MSKNTSRPDSISYEMKRLLSDSSELQQMSTHHTEEGDLVSSQGQASYTSMDSESLRYRSQTGGELEGSKESDANDEFVNIQGLDPTAQALQQCERWVLAPYRIMLKLLGWTSFHRDGDSIGWKIVRLLLILFWVATIITAFITQILSCFRRDMFPSREVNESQVLTCKEHLISSYILTDFLLIASYLFGLYLFSRGETEYLSNLAEQVFIKSYLAKCGPSTNWWLIGSIILYFVLGLAWIVTSFIVRILTAVAIKLFSDDTTIEWSSSTTFEDGGKIALVIMSLLGFISFDIVYVVAVMNYAAQSEMNIYLIRAVTVLVQRKEYPEIDAAIKDILECRKYLRVLNGKTATATALILFNLGAAGLVALVTLDQISEKELENEALATTTAGLNVVLWAGLVSFPFLQAARVTDACDKLRDTGPEIRSRPLQYMNTPLLELDSYVLVTQSVRLRATMFGVPIYPWMAYSVLVVFGFTMLVLFQLGTYNFTLYL